MLFGFNKDTLESIKKYCNENNCTTKEALEFKAEQMISSGNDIGLNKEQIVDFMEKELIFIENEQKMKGGEKYGR